MDKGFHAFSEYTSPKLNVIVWLEIEHAHFEVTVQYVFHYALGAPRDALFLLINKKKSVLLTIIKKWPTCK